MHSKQLGHYFLSPKTKRNGTINRTEDKENGGKKHSQKKKKRQKRQNKIRKWQYGKTSLEFSMNQIS